MAALGTASFWRCTSFSFQMAHQLSGHLWNAAILVASASVALAADRLTAPPKRAGSGVGLDAGSVDDIAGFVVPMRSDSDLPRFHMSVWIDPFNRRGAVVEPSVASDAGAPTVRSSSSASRGLTAILISNERRVAVIDDATVGVGDVLRDGARVSAIQPDRVWVVEKNGQWRMLTLSNRSAR